MLDFLFVAETHNGNIIKQTPEDIARFGPKDKSAFYDVLKENVKRFSLVGKGHVFTVDLTDGHFEIDGRYLYTKKPPERAPLQLIYYRQVQQRMVSGYETRPDGTRVETQQLKPVMRYFIGWQTNVRGKNYKFELGVD